MRASILAGASAVLVACGTSSSPSSPTDGGTTPPHDANGIDANGGDDGGGTDATIVPPFDAGPPDTTCAGPCPTSSIKHLVVIVQENHTFDDHFGAYCTATPGSNPTCNTGPACCEAMPATDPKGTKPTVLTDAEHASFDPNHAKACELTEIDDGKMDGFASTSVSGCGAAENVAIADPNIIKPYWDLAATGALADRYFQPLVGESSGNDMYLARADWVFDDNNAAPKGATGVTCDVESAQTQYANQTIGDLLAAATVPWTWFSAGYDAMIAADGGCPPKPDDCPFPLAFYPCAFEPADVPFEYYASTKDDPATMQDLSVLDAALTGTGELPAVSFVKAIGYEQEHPGNSCTLSGGVARATSIISAIEASKYSGDTLVVLTYDEGGGYFDHVAPPAANAVDNEPYGTRIPFLVVGPFARKNFVSHVTMEHSSLVKFIEWNWLGGTTGQLGTRDTVVANIGSVLDPTTTGVAVPEN
jgi:phospholipase C